jgi:NADPH-dependent ferric siderophore reductase
MTDTTAAASDAIADAEADARVMAALDELAPDLLGHLNTEYEDSVLFIGRILCERPAATAARVTTVDRRGADMVVTDPAGEHAHRLDFANELTEATKLTTELFALVTTARARSGEPGATSAEIVMRELTGIRTFLTRVVAVDDIHPHLRQITFGGGDLSTFAPAGPDTFLYLLLPPEGRTELTIDQTFTWSGYEEMPEAERPVGAYYTLRRWRPDAHELDILCVLHGDTGPASRWAERARPGDPVALWGPRTAYAPPAGTDWYLLVADETGLPAVAAILESLPEGTTARVFAEVEDESEHHDLPTSPTFEVVWLHRDGSPVGTTTLLADAVRALPWPGGTPYVWGGGESRTMTAVRRYVRHEVGLAREQVSLVAYWRHDAHAGDPPDDEE